MDPFNPQNAEPVSLDLSSMFGASITTDTDGVHRDADGRVHRLVDVDGETTFEPIEVDGGDVVAKAKASILADIAAGLVPGAVSCFADLHGYVDANEYLIDADPDWTPESSNALSAVLDAWLREGGHRAPATPDGDGGYRQPPSGVSAIGHVTSWEPPAWADTVTAGDDGVVEHFRPIGAVVAAAPDTPPFVVAIRQTDTVIPAPDIVRVERSAVEVTLLGYELAPAEARELAGLLVEAAGLAVSQ